MNTKNEYLILKARRIGCEENVIFSKNLRGKKEVRSNGEKIAIFEKSTALS